MRSIGRTLYLGYLIFLSISLHATWYVLIVKDGAICSKEVSLTVLLTWYICYLYDVYNVIQYWKGKGYFNIKYKVKKKYTLGHEGIYQGIHFKLYYKKWHNFTYHELAINLAIKDKKEKVTLIQNAYYEFRTEQEAIYYYKYLHQERNAYTFGQFTYYAYYETHDQKMVYSLGGLKVLGVYQVHKNKFHYDSRASIETDMSLLTRGNKNSELLQFAEVRAYFEKSLNTENVA